jgi:hypothetical protein
MGSHGHTFSLEIVAQNGMPGSDPETIPDSWRQR